MTIDRRSTDNRRVASRVIGYGLWGLVVVFALVFLWRGPVRGVVGESRDGSMLYAASKAWVQGENPYDGQACIGVLRENGGAGVVAEASPHQFASLYPPTLFPVLSSLTALSWPAAKVVGAGLNLAAVCGIIVLLCRLPGVPGGRWRLFIVLMVLAWAPLQTSAALGQLTGVILLLVLLGLSLRPAWAGGLCIGLASAMKPQIGLPFLFFLAWERQWAALGYGAVVGMVVSGLAIIRLTFTAPTWRLDLANNLAIVADPKGGIASPSPNNPLVYQMIDSAPLLARYLDNPRWVALLVAALAGVSACAALVMARRYALADRWLLMVAGVAVVPMLPVYHRFYDATMLLLVVAWVAGRWAVRPGDRLAMAAILLLLPFWVPGSAILAVLERRGTVPAAITDRGWWDAVVMQHQSWLVLLLLAVLLGALATGRRSGNDLSAQLDAGLS